MNISNCHHILRDLIEIYKAYCKKDDIHEIERTFLDVLDLFTGKMEGYQKCDTKYHDLQHTMDEIGPMARIMDGWNRSKESPAISKKIFELGIIAVLFHDAGYIKKTGDTKGTGGKYTFRHIKRGKELVKNYLYRQGYSDRDVGSVHNIIACTELEADVSKLTFKSTEEKIVGFSLGTSDLITQMAAENYVEKLPYLFKEYKEAYEYEGMDKLQRDGITIFKSEEHLVKYAPHFYENVVKKRLETMGALYRFLAFPSRGGKNPYLESIEKNMEKIKSQYLSIA